MAEHVDATVGEVSELTQVADTSSPEPGPLAQLGDVGCLKLVAQSRRSRESFAPRFEGVEERSIGKSNNATGALLSAQRGLPRLEPRGERASGAAFATRAARPLSHSPVMPSASGALLPELGAVLP